MKGQLRIDAMYAFVVIDTDGTEGVPAMPGSNGIALPLVGADMERMDSLRPAAAEMAKSLGRPLEMVRFTRRQHLAWIRAGDAPTPVRPSKPAERAPFRTLAEPVLSDVPIIHADGITVAGAVVDGKPAVVVIYHVDGKEIPMAVTGQRAADLVPLVADAWEAAKALES